MASGEISTLVQGDIDEYLKSLRSSVKFGSQVVWVEEIAAKNACFVKPQKLWPEAIETATNRLGLPELYSHQAEAVNYIRNGESVIVATPTASGKSLIYNLPIFETLLENPQQHALYLFPLKALAQDQLLAIDQFAALLPKKSRPRAAIYDGDTSAYRRKKIREFPPEILISNPDMLHLSMLAYHGSWGGFFAGLSHVVLDEVHTYRGVFGSHMAWVLRRLQRICNFYGNDPLFILSSATVGNPEKLAENLLGKKTRAVVVSGAPRGEHKFVFFDPIDSAIYAASQMLEAALKRGLRTIVYCQSRKITELVAMRTVARLGPLHSKLAAYRAGFLPEDRREIEAKLTNGELLGVVSTSALELGIDIGELEICILVGYPGSIMATWQRGGRVGRRQDKSLVVLIAQEDALDKYFMRNPADFFKRKVEDAILNPANQEIIKQHLVCLAAEGPIGVSEQILQSSGAQSALDELGKSGKLLLGADGKHWFTVRKYPQRLVNLRGSGNGFLIKISSDNSLLGEVDGLRCLKECHPGAIYLQMGRTYIVDSLDMELREVRVTAKKVSYFTRAISHKETEILEVFTTKSMGNYKVSSGRLRVTDTVSAFQRFTVRGHKLIATEHLDLPPSVFETEGLWLHIPATLQQRVVSQQVNFMGGIHALEHAAIGVFPLLVLCDRNDVGGISMSYNDQLQSAAIFIYDGHEGGIGLSKQAFDKVDILLAEALQVISGCPCSSGCPSCVHSPKCGSGNRPIDKQAARLLLEALLAEGEEANTLPPEMKIASPVKRRIPLLADVQGRRLHFGVFDLETQRSAAEVGGWHRAERMGISAVVLYDSNLDEYLVFQEAEIEQFIDHLRGLPLVVGFNNKRFDNRVLSAYTSYNLGALPTIDILEEVNEVLGYRLSLDRLAKHTLGSHKTADGLQALKWYKQGLMEEIIKYCKTDVRITKDLFLFGIQNGYLLFQNKAGFVVRCPFCP